MKLPRGRMYWKVKTTKMNSVIDLLDSNISIWLQSIRRFACYHRGGARRDMRLFGNNFIYVSHFLVLVTCPTDHSYLHYTIPTNMNYSRERLFRVGGWLFVWRYCINCLCYLASNERTCMNEILSRTWLISRHYPRICLEGLKKNNKPFVGYWLSGYRFKLEIFGKWSSMIFIWSEMCRNH